MLYFYGNEEVKKKLFELGANASFYKRALTGNPVEVRDHLLKPQKAGTTRRMQQVLNAAGTDRSNIIVATDRFPAPTDEASRVKKLAELHVANMDVDPCLDIIVRSVSEQIRLPIAAVSLVDADTSWAKTTVEIARGPYARHQSMCAHALCKTEPMIVTDAISHPVFSKLHVVLKAPCVRSYAGVPIMSKDGVRLGTICVADSRPRHISPAEVAALTSPARLVADFIQTPVAEKGLAA